MRTETFTDREAATIRDCLAMFRDEYERKTGYTATDTRSCIAKLDNLIARPDSNGFHAVQILSGDTEMVCPGCGMHSFERI